MKKLVVILSVAIVVASGIALSFWRQLEADRRQIADLQAQLQQMQAVQQASAAALARQAPAITEQPASAESPVAPATRPRPAASGVVATAASELIKQLTSPEGREVRRAQLRMLLPQQYPNIGKWLNLSREEEDKLFDLIARQEAERSEARLDPAIRNNPAAQQEMTRNLQAKRQADDAELAALLGNKYPQFQEYQQTTTVHRQVSQLQAMVGSGADGLSDAQARSLTTALVAEQLRINQERSGTPLVAQGRSLQETLQEQQRRTAENNRRLLDVAASQLNAQQLEGYRKLIEQRERASSVVTRALGNAATAAPATDR